MKDFLETETKKQIQTSIRIYSLYAPNNILILDTVIANQICESEVFRQKSFDAYYPVAHGLFKLLYLIIKRVYI